MDNKLSINHVKLGTIILLMIVTAIISGLTSGIIVYSSYGKNAGVSYKTINEDKSLKEFLEVYNQVTTEYYEDVNKEELIESAIDAMLNYLGDKYTSYMDVNETQDLVNSLKGEYRGIGVLISNHTIVDVFEDTPAYAAGLKVNDEIIKVNNEDVADKSAADISSSIRNSSQNEVLVTVKRGNETIDLTIEISKLDVPTIATDVIEGTDIGYLELASFSATSLRQTEKAIKKLNDKNISSLIIDVRGNSGGFLSSAEGISNLFIEKGKVLYSLKGKDYEKTVKDESLTKADYKIVVLIDENTASAAEIFAAALKDSYGATLVGKKSYGKGKVQQVVKFSNGSMAKYTSAKWYRPNGECIDGVGINPDYEVDLTIVKDKDGKVTDIKDSQLDKAIELLS